MKADITQLVPVKRSVEFDLFTYASSSEHLVDPWILDAYKQMDEIEVRQLSREEAESHFDIEETEDVVYEINFLSRFGKRYRIYFDLTDANGSDEYKVLVKEGEEYKVIPEQDYDKHFVGLIETEMLDLTDWSYLLWALVWCAQDFAAKNPKFDF